MLRIETRVKDLVPAVDFWWGFSFGMNSIYSKKKVQFIALSTVTDCDLFFPLENNCSII